MFAVAVSGDLCGGAINAAGQSFVTIDGVAVVTVGDPVTGHGSGSHAAATMSAGSPIVTINGIPICRTGDAATCGDTATGSSHITSD